MKEELSLQRFVDAQETAYSRALAEVSRGKKESHWMWYIFPQMKGLGFSSTAQYYAIQSLSEARQYLEHPVLGPRLVTIATALLALKTSDPHIIFGSPDDAKLKSSMTLFTSVDGADPVFAAV